MRTIESLAELPGLVGQELAVSGWITVTQQQIDLFADATGDHQWIHIDPERAKSGPFGTTIAHGFLTLSLIPKMVESCLEIRNQRMSVNYGLNRVRFPAPVPSGSRLRARIKLAACETMADGGYQVVSQVTVEREGSDNPSAWRRPWPAATAEATRAYGLQKKCPPKRAKKKGVWVAWPALIGPVSGQMRDRTARFKHSRVKRSFACVPRSAGLRQHLRSPVAARLRTR